MLAVAATTLLPNCARAATPQKHALLIGVSDYHKLHPNDDAPLFPNLNCDEDIDRIQQVLSKTFGFGSATSSRDFIILKQPEETTRAAILAAFDRVLSETHSGDLVYIHFSGHGSQVPDPTKPEGLESTIVPSDYKDDQSNEITGREINQFLNRLRTQKHPGQIVVSIDSCHSGTVSRGLELKRGLSYDQYLDWFQAKYHKLPPQVLAPKTGQSVSTNIMDLNDSDCVVLSACANDQSAYECTDNGKQMGRFSYCLTQILGQSTPSTTYRQIFDQVRALFREKYSDQAPQLDGDPDAYLLGGTAKEPPNSLLVSLPASGPSDVYTLDSGRLQGLSMGSEYAIYDKDALNFTTDQELAEAKIVKLDLTSATVKVTKAIRSSITADRFQGGHAVETRHNYATPPLTLDPVSVKKAVPDMADAILAKLNDPDEPLHTVRTALLPDEKPDILMEKQGMGATSTLALVRGDTGYAFRELDPAQDLPRQLFAALQKEARYRYAIGLGVDQPGLNHSYHLDLRLVPAAVKKDERGFTVLDHDLPSDSEATLKVNDYFTIEVQNTSPKPLYVTVLDLESNGNISQRWPSSDSTTEDNIIQPTPSSQWTKLWKGSDKTRPSIFRVTSPDPHEIYKAIATDQFVSFKAIRSRDVTANPESPFSDLFIESGARSTPDGIYAVDPKTWTAATYIFRVVDLP